jgi:hypothetical protein
LGCFCGRHLDAEPALQSLKRSKIKDNVRRMVELLKADAQKVKANAALLSMSSPRSAKSTKSADEEASAGLVIDSLLQTRFVEQLCHRAMRDRPVGAMAMLLQCIARIIDEVQYPLLATISIRNTLADLLPRAAAYSAQYKSNLPVAVFEQTKELVQMNLVLLLRAIWRRIADDPNQIDFFLHPLSEVDASVSKRLFPPETNGTDGDTDGEGAEARSDIGGEQRQPQQQQQQPKPSLRIQPSAGVAGAQIDILTPLVQCALLDSDLGKYAREALLISVSLKETIVCDFLATRTSLIPDLADAMAAAYRVLPKTLDAQKVKPKGMLSTLAKFANMLTDLASKESVMERTASPRRLPARGELNGRDFASFVTGAVLDRFVYPVLVPALTEPSEERSMTACRYTAVMLQAMANVGHNAPLLEAFAKVILSEATAVVRDKLVGAINSPSARVVTEVCNLLAKAVGLASTDTAVHAMLTVQVAENKNDNAGADETESRPAAAGLAKLELFESRFEGINFRSDKASELENMAIRTVARQCAVHISRPRTHVNSRRRFRPSPLLDALLVRSKAFATIGVDAQNALLVLYSCLLGHACAAQILPTASAYELRASDALLSMLYGAAYQRRYPGDAAAEPTLAAVDIAAKVWHDIYSHVRNIPAWEQKLDLARQAWDVGLSSFDADSSVEPTAQVVLFACCMLEEWILGLHAYLVASDTLSCEASMLRELHTQQAVGQSPLRYRSGSGADAQAGGGDEDSVVGEDEFVDRFDTTIDTDGLEEALDAEVDAFFATLDELARDNPAI